MAEELVPVSAEKKADPNQPASQPTENAIIVGSILEFLQSEKGSQLANKVVSFFEEWKSQQLKLAKHATMWGTISQLATLVLVLGVALYATLTGKMDAVLAGLIGTLAGYVLGKKSAS